MTQNTANTTTPIIKH